MNLLIEYAANLYDAFIATWFVLKLNKSILKQSKWFFPTILVIFILSNIFTHLSGFSVWLTIAILVLLWIYAFTIKSGKIIIRILSPVIYTVVLIITNSTIIYVLSNVLNIPIADLVTKSFLGRYLHIFLCKLVMTTVLVLITKFFDFDKRFSIFDLLIYLLFPCITFINLYVFIKLGIEYDISSYSVLIIFIVLALAIINFLTFILFKKSVQNTSAKYELELINSRKELEEERYRELGILYSQFRITRHDIKEHLLYINCLMENKQYDEVNLYINEKQSELDKTSKICHTNNRMVDYIISSKIMQHNDIIFTITGELSGLEQMEDLDLTVLLGNMLSNSINGTMPCDLKQIIIEFNIHGNYQNITCKNTIAKSVLKTNPDLKTTNNNKLHHGYGVKSMQKIVEKYDGLIEFYEENEKFCVHIALPIKTIEENS